MRLLTPNSRRGGGGGGDYSEVQHVLLRDVHGMPLRRQGATTPVRIFVSDRFAHRGIRATGNIQLRRGWIMPLQVSVLRMCVIIVAAEAVLLI